MMKEVFRPIKGYEGKYEISNLRRVKSLGRVVQRSDGRIRTIQERFIYADMESICLGSGKTGGKRHDPLHLMIDAFHKGYSSKKYSIFSRVDKDKAMLSDIMLLPKLRYNRLTVRDNLGNYTSYKNLYEFCEKHDIESVEGFLRILFKGWTKFKYTHFDGWTFAFRGPVTLEKDTKIILTLTDVRSDCTKRYHVSRKQYMQKYRLNYDNRRPA